MNSLDEAREYIIEKEIDTTMRKSHSEHFDYLESKLAIELRKNRPIWQTFIEITERRNLLVHCDGIISTQYLKVCKEQKCQLEKSKAGERLTVDLEYFMQAYKCLYEISVKLTHTLWRKLLKNDLENADKQLNEICYSLISNGGKLSFELADILLSFVCEQKKHFNDSLKNVFIINRALSKYLQGQRDEAKKILESKDWSASSDDFKLANSILTDNYDNSYMLMRKIGRNGDVKKSYYSIWPLFNEIRKETRFQEVYKEVFGEDYKVLETPMRPIQELINIVYKKEKGLSDQNIDKKDVEDINKDSKPKSDHITPTNETEQVLE